MNRYRFVLAASLVLARLSYAADTAPEHVHNFAAVNERIFRGAEPSLDALQELSAMGIKTILDLREDGNKSRLEKETAEKLGMHYVHVPMRRLGAPTPAEIEQALLVILKQDADKIFVHCWRGKDRTGTVIACYRIQHDEWDNRKALEEAKRFGMSNLERAMQSYILHFTPISFPDLLKAGN